MEGSGRNPIAFKKKRSETLSDKPLASSRFPSGTPNNIKTLVHVTSCSRGARARFALPDFLLDLSDAPARRLRRPEDDITPPVCRVEESLVWPNGKHKPRLAREESTPERSCVEHKLPAAHPKPPSRAILPPPQQTEPHAPHASTTNSRCVEL
eukprot:EC689944.1.p1 GENE.EC689944.1~~EC689944.1.p1  ORF type:complete len:153 (-),score=4.43 EC689944.1:3-461(-)